MPPLMLRKSAQQNIRPPKHNPLPGFMPGIHVFVCGGHCA
jgi:hypothetical protein